MPDWIKERLGIIIFVVIIVVQIVRGIFRARRDAPPPPSSKPDELEEQRRVQEIQEQIRRRIAERRGEAVPQGEPPPLVRTEQAEPPPRPIARPETTQMPDVFGGPLRRMMEEFERKVQPPVPPPVLERTAQETGRRNAGIERQERLADEIKALEDARLVTLRRAANVAAAKQAATQTEGALRTVARGHLLDDLRDPQTLRRAIVLREVLGPPVALR